MVLWVNIAARSETQLSVYCSPRCRPRATNAFSLHFNPSLAGEIALEENWDLPLGNAIKPRQRLQIDLFELLTWISDCFNNTLPPGLVPVP
jgi:hypothetical protein